MLSQVKMCCSGLKACVGYARGFFAIAGDPKYEPERERLALYLRVRARICLPIVILLQIIDLVFNEGYDASHEDLHEYKDVHADTAKHVVPWLLPLACAFVVVGTAVWAASFYWNRAVMLFMPITMVSYAVLSLTPE